MLRVAMLFAASVSLCLTAGCHLVSAGRSCAFLGDSITEGWYYPTVNLGVHGNTTAQMLSRFPNLIPGRGYKTVVILGGTNDTLLGISPDETVRNLDEIGQLAVGQHAEPVLCEVPPIFHGLRSNDRTDYRPAVVTLNRRISHLASARHWKLVDYYSPLAGHPTFSSDGVHWKRRGYFLMEGALLKQLPPF